MNDIKNQKKVSEEDKPEDRVELTYDLNNIVNEINKNIERIEEVEYNIPDNIVVGIYHIYASKIKKSIIDKR